MSTYYSEINEAEILGQISPIRSHPDFNPSFSEIVDFSGVTGGNLSTSAIQDLSGRVSVFNPKSMHVVIAPQPHIFGLTRLAQRATKKSLIIIGLAALRGPLCGPQKDLV
ncbi:MAG TPA: hypothetical protein VJY15_00615 [Candidatus Acidoferrum sp.]|nr:hypothetical protein [Candidatus Acidoferrum sp.]